MWYPVKALESARGLLGDRRGSALVADERIADRFAAPAGELERLMYRRIFHCLLVGMAGEASGHRHGDAPETRPPLRGGRGLGGFEVLPIENDYTASTASTPDAPPQ